MKPSSRIILTVVLLLIVAGCFSPRSTADKKMAAVDKAKAAEQANRDKQGDLAATLVHGTGLALSRAPLTNPAVRVAYELNSRASVAAGPPPYEGAVEMAAIVAGATSGDSKQAGEADRRLKAFDERIEALQAVMERLEGKTARAEERRDETFRDFAVELGTWRGIKRALIFGGLGLVVLILGPVVLGLIGTFFPAVAPITGIGSKLLGGLGRSVMRVVPSVARDAGVVAREEYDKARAAAEDLNTAIAELKAREREAFDRSVAPVLKTTSLARAGTETDTAEFIAKLRARARSPVT